MGSVVPVKLYMVYTTFHHRLQVEVGTDLIRMPHKYILQPTAINKEIHLALKLVEVEHTFFKVACQSQAAQGQMFSTPP